MKFAGVFLALASVAAAAPLVVEERSVDIIIQKRDDDVSTVVVPVVATVTVTVDPANPSPVQANLKQDAQPQPQPQPQQQQQQQQQQAEVQPVQKLDPAPSSAAPVSQPSPNPGSSGSSGSTGSSGGSSPFPVETLEEATVPDGPGPFKGSATTYDPSPAAGSCGEQHYPSDMIFAVSHLMMGKKSNGNTLCGRKARITGPTGKSQIATMADKCMGCTNLAETEPYNIDLTQALFDAIGGGDGRIDGVTWEWVQ